MEILHILFADVNVLNGALIVIHFSLQIPTSECATSECAIHTLSLCLQFQVWFPIILFSDAKILSKNICTVNNRQINVCVFRKPDHWN